MMNCKDFLSLVNHSYALVTPPSEGRGWQECLFTLSPVTTVILDRVISLGPIFFICKVWDMH